MKYTPQPPVASSYGTAQSRPGTSLALQPAEAWAGQRHLVVLRGRGRRVRPRALLAGVGGQMPPPLPPGSLKRSQHLGPSDIYLDDLPSLDSENAALYFPQRCPGSGLRGVLGSRPAGPGVGSQGPGPAPCLLLLFMPLLALLSPAAVGWGLGSGVLPTARSRWGTATPSRSRSPLRTQQAPWCCPSVGAWPTAGTSPQVCSAVALPSRGLH